LTPRALLDILTRLIDRSLVRVGRQAGDVRYRMLETLSEYAREKLEETGETDHLRQLHCSYFVNFAEEAAPKLKGAEQFEWLDRLELEHDNLRAAWDWAINNDDESALRLAQALLDYWLMRGNPSEGRLWLAQLLPQTVLEEQTSNRARVLGVAGRLAYAQRDFVMAQWLLEESLSHAREAGNKTDIAFALWWLGRIAIRRRDDQTAQAFTAESLTLYQGLHDRWGIAMAIYQLADLAAVQSQFTQAEERYLDSLAKFKEIGDKYRVGYVLNGLGELSRLRGDYERAGKCYGEHIEILREQRSPVALVAPLVNQAWVALHRSDYSKAKALFEETLILSNEHGNKSAMVDCLAGFASVLGMIGRPGQAAQLFGAVESLLESLGMAGRLDPSDQKEFDHYVAAVRSQLDEAAFEKAWAEGRGMTSEQAIAFAVKESKE
jgi:non-specific serine/threonine protein kinase